MSKRGDVELLKDILESPNRIQRYVGTFTLAGFMTDTQAQDAVVRNLSIIGEAVKNLSAEFREEHQEVEWAKIAGLRDKLVHDYFSLDWDILWDVVRTKIPTLREQVLALLPRDAAE
jgi:uncharacterized protein with HEPN domain